MENSRYKMKDLAYEQIRQMIITGKLVPGQKVTENALAIQLDMGRTPVREAVLALAHDQLVIIHPRKYIEIAHCSPERINEIFELRICLEPSVLRRHARAIDVVELLELKQRITDNITLYEENNSAVPAENCYPRDVVETDEELHTMLIEAAGNSMISHVFSNFMDYTSLLWEVNSRLVSLRALQSDREHLAIIDAILENNIDQACQLLCQHLERSRNALINEMLLKWGSST